MVINGEGDNYSNISKEKQQALKTLKILSDIVIKEADKGGAIVVWYMQDYLDNLVIKRSMSLLKLSF